MSERNEGRVPIAKEYPDMSAFNQDTRDVFAGKDTGMYQRYDYKELVADERKFAEMIGVPDTALFNSGMAAIHTAIEAEGLKPGDVIMEINQNAVTTPESVNTFVENARRSGRSSVLLLINRAGDVRFVALRLADK